MSRAFNLSFRMYMEGVLTPFKSANIMCTPNGVEMSINIYANRMVYDLKPKTAVQIFYKDWISGINQGWRLMGDGFFSAITKEDNSTEGRMVSILCRDFRMDIRRSPAYLSYTGDQPLGTLNMYAMQGLYETGIEPGMSPGSVKKIGNREYDNLLCTLSSMMSYIAGTAYGTSNKPQPKSTNKPKTVVSPTSGNLTVPITNAATAPSIPQTSVTLNRQYAPSDSNVGFAKTGNPTETNASDFVKSLTGTDATPVNYITNPPISTETKLNYEPIADTMQLDEHGKAKCGLFLDAFIRGMWTEAVAGTSVGVFTNRRIRMDKRFLVPSNRSGYNFWHRQSAGIEVGGYMMSDSRFSSLEAAIMRCAALFSVRVYSCNTPTLIPVSLDKSQRNPYSSDPYGATPTNLDKTAASTQGKVLDFIIDDKVRETLIDNKNAKFGGKYILNESMLLPPMEFTAPPNCNIFLPPFCNRTSWQFDMDADITRGYYSVVDSFSGYDSDGALNRLGVQVPNTLFDASVERSNLYKGASKIDQYGRFKPPITLEERYKGINLSYGQVNQDIAMNEVVAERIANPNSSNKEKIDKINNKKDQINSGIPKIDFTYSWDNSAGKTQYLINKKKIENDKKKQKQLSDPTTNSLRRHALIKYLNEKYAGRVVTIDMMFNPYPMCGFPGMFVDDEEAGGRQSAKTIIGMVQQVKHLIFITPNGAEASTTVLMNNARFVDEPTDMDVDGNALYMGKTDRYKAAINIDTILYSDKNYHIPEPVSETARLFTSKAYDMAELSNPGSVYAKDFLSLTEASSKGGRSNIYYLDKEYDPQHIALFYKKVFQHTENSFMIGSESGTPEAGNSTLYFMYDTIHEAVTDLRANRKDLMYDYEAAMKYVSRNVCSADAFYQGILGLSKRLPITGKYVCNEEEFDDTDIKDEYFGITTDNFNNAGNNPKGILYTMIDSGLMEGDGDLSSILETTPITAFIKERKESVKSYIKEANQFAQGMRFTAPEEK